MNNGDDLDTMNIKEKGVNVNKVLHLKRNKATLSPSLELALVSFPWAHVRKINMVQETLQISFCLKSTFGGHWIGESTDRIN